MQFGAATRRGHHRAHRQDIRYAEELGYRIKLLGIAKRSRAGIELRVHPTLIPARRLIANVEGVMNAILVKGDAVGQTMYYGAGAGAEPTASAVVADLVDVARMHTADPEHRVPHLAFQPDRLSNIADPADGRSRDRVLPAHAGAGPAGVLADITRILADSDISIEAMVQKEPHEGEEQVDIIMLTHRTHREERGCRPRKDRSAARRGRQGDPHPARSSTDAADCTAYEAGDHGALSGAHRTLPRPTAGVL
jgi:homoserine dehydrogenase